jgi:hypothetical protein
MKRASEEWLASATSVKEDTQSLDPPSQPIERLFRSTFVDLLLNRDGDCV